MRDQAPLQEVERALTSLMVLPDDQQLVARGGVVTARDIAQAAIADIKPPRQSPDEEVLNSGSHDHTWQTTRRDSLPSA
jgi:hypothetical protein